MDAKAHETMRQVLKHYVGFYFDQPWRVLDVGSLNVNGTYRDLMPPAWAYRGSDIRAGANVDIVQPGPYRIQKDSEQYDIVITGQTLEHVERPWLLVPEMGRMLRPGGYLIMTAPFVCGVHKHPVDCWRFLPWGFYVLFQEAGLRTIKVWLHEDYCWGVAQKGAGLG